MHVVLMLHKKFPSKLTKRKVAFLGSGESTSKNKKNQKKHMEESQALEKTAVMIGE